jgi:hypothetical protein
MVDTNPLVQNERLNEMAMAYLKERFLAICASVSVIENSYREGMLTRDEFLTIRESLMGARREVQVALDSITGMDGASISSPF